MQDSLCYCSDIDSLMNELGIQHIPNEWRLFIDSSKSSLKAVLLHNGNDYPSVPIGHSVHMRESFENMAFLLDHIKHLQFNWYISCDLKVIGLLMGLQSGYTKYCCFMCELDSRARNLHYVEKNWNPRQNLVPGIKNVSQRPLVEPQKVHLSPLHIKLGLIKNFVKVIVKHNRDSEGLVYLRSKFPGISDAIIKEGVFIDAEIRDLINDIHFDLTLNTLERAAWVAFKDVVAGLWKIINQISTKKWLTLCFLTTRLWGAICL